MGLCVCGPDFYCHLSDVAVIRLMTTIIKWVYDPNPSGRFLHIGLTADALYIRVAETSLDKSVPLPDDTHLMQVIYDGGVGNWTFTEVDINRFIIGMDQIRGKGALWAYWTLHAGGVWRTGPLPFSVS